MARTVLLKRPLIRGELTQSRDVEVVYGAMVGKKDGIRVDRELYFGISHFGFRTEPFYREVGNDKVKELVSDGGIERAVRV